MIKNQYPYKYEMHLHTNEASACARNSGAEMVRAHYEAGYSGIFVTNHAWGGNTCIDRHLPYKEWVKQFASGYYNALAEGEKIGMDVFFGLESGFQGTEFLIYGISPEWLMEHENLWNASIEEQYKIIRAGGGIVIHAHPYREEPYIPEIRLFPDFVDGVEICNATHSSHLSISHNDPEYDVRARAYAKKHDFIGIAGSDVHSVNVFGGGTLFKTRLKNNDDLVNAVLNREDYILTDGESFYSNTGDLLQL